MIFGTKLIFSALFVREKIYSSAKKYQNCLNPPPKSSKLCLLTSSSLTDQIRPAVATNPTVDASVTDQILGQCSCGGKDTTVSITADWHFTAEGEGFNTVRETSIDWMFLHCCGAAALWHCISSTSNSTYSQPSSVYNIFVLTFLTAYLNLSTPLLLLSTFMCPQLPTPQIVSKTIIVFRYYQPHNSYC